MTYDEMARAMDVINAAAEDMEDLDSATYMADGLEDLHEKDSATYERVAADRLAAWQLAHGAARKGA